jgi:TolB-like protein
MGLILAGCGAGTVSKSFLREEVDFGFIQRIAVLPFENNSNDPYAAERARDVTITQVLSLGMFDAVEKVLVDNVMFEEGIDRGAPIDPLTFKRVGQRLQCQAILLGTIDLAGTGKIGTAAFSEMAMTLRLIEVNSGLILWQASGNLSGASFARRLFGLKPDDPYQLTLKLVRDLLKTAPSGYL